jgi:predicted SAM-dependent methyltransferase
VKGKNVEEIWHEQLRSLPVETVRDCLLCGEVAGQHDDRWYRYLGLIEPYDVLRCPQCGLRWLSPRPDAEGYRKLYSSDMYFGGKGASPADYRDEAKNRVDYWRARVRTAAAMLERDGSALAFFDYGAATGEFVRVALEEGHGCIGMELSSDARAEAKTRNGVSLLAPEQMGEISDVRFDVIHMNHVLEHMPNPLAHLRWCANRLNPQGLLVLEVPQQFDNDLDRLRRWLRAGGKRPHFDAYSLHHTYFFNPGTMTTLLRKAGFEIKTLATFNRSKTPLWPPTLTNWILRPMLSSADVLHRGGNIIEVYATPA